MAAPTPDRQLQWQHMTREQRRAAERLTSDLSANLAPHMRGLADQLEGQIKRNPTGPNAKSYGFKRNRLLAAAEVAPEKPVAIETRAKRRVQAVTESATSDRRLPHENLPGVGWYFHAHGELQANAPNTPFPVAAAASSAMSPRTDPKTERSALRALDTAHSSGKVRFHPEVIASLGTKGVAVPHHLRNRTVDFGDIPTGLVGAMTDVAHQDVLKRHSDNVRWSAMAGVASRDNVAKAVAIMRGEQPAVLAQNPGQAPKTFGYTYAQRESVPGSPEHHEYMARGAHLGEVLRGETSGRQDMLDLWGRRSSNEGVLSNKAPTAEDSWMRSVSEGIPRRGLDRRQPNLFKAGGDVDLQRKTHEGAPAAPVGYGPQAVAHAVENRATQRAAEMLQRHHGLGYTVPAIMVQETSWTGPRREVGRDPEYNQQAAHRAALDRQHETSEREGLWRTGHFVAGAAAPRRSEKQPRLPGM